MIFQIVYVYSQKSMDKSNPDKYLLDNLNYYNFFQVLISSDYLIMAELKVECLQWLKDNFINIIIEAYYKDEKEDIPVDQIEDSLLESICLSINADPNYIVDLVRLEKLLGQEIEYESETESELMASESDKMEEEDRKSEL